MEERRFFEHAATAGTMQATQVPSPIEGTVVVKQVFSETAVTEPELSDETESVLAPGNQGAVSSAHESVLQVKTTPGEEFSFMLSGAVVRSASDNAESGTQEKEDGGKPKTSGNAAAEQEALECHAVTEVEDGLSADHIDAEGSKTVITLSESS